MFTHFVDAVGMLRKQNHHSKAEAISKLTVLPQLLLNYLSTAKIYILYMIKFGRGVRC